MAEQIIEPLNERSFWKKIAGLFRKAPAPKPQKPYEPRICCDAGPAIYRTCLRTPDKECGTKLYMNNHVYCGHHFVNTDDSRECSDVGPAYLRECKRPESEPCPRRLSFKPVSDKGYICGLEFIDPVRNL